MQIEHVALIKRKPIGLKVAVYNTTVIRPVLIYGSETWEMRKAEQDLLERTVMRIFSISDTGKVG